jgi:hypothetical protein
MMISLSYFSDRNITNRQQSHTVPRLIQTVSPTRGKSAGRGGEGGWQKWAGRGGGEGRLGEGFEGLASAG